MMTQYRSEYAQLQQDKHAFYMNREDPFYTITGSDPMQKQARNYILQRQFKNLRNVYL